jgi:hypothetical protein
MIAVPFSMIEKRTAYSYNLPLTARKVQPLPKAEPTSE